jgi:hypothetical protein
MIGVFSIHIHEFDDYKKVRRLIHLTIFVSTLVQFLTVHSWDRVWVLVREFV